MKNIYQLFLLNLLLIFIFSCENTGNQLSKYPARLIKAENRIQFTIDDSTSFENNNLIASVINEEEVLIVESKQKNSIQFYSFENGKKIKEIIFSKVGIEPVHEIHGFTMINQDSIMIFDKWRSLGYIVNSEGTVIERIYLTNSKVLNHASMTRTPNVEVNGKICLFIFPRVNIENDRIFDGNTNFELVYDLKTKSSSFIDFSWPEMYRGKKWTFFHTFPSRIKGKDDKLVYSFGADHNIYEVSLDGSYRTIEAKSDFFEEINSLSNGEDETEAFLKNGVYGMIIYDKYRDVYYRIAGLKTNPRTSDGGRKQVSHKQYSIIILDNKLNKIGETLLEPFEEFLIKDWFVCKSGLCISTANYLNGNINENVMEFNLLKLINE